KREPGCGADPAAGRHRSDGPRLAVRQRAVAGPAARWARERREAAGETHVARTARTCLPLRMERGSLGCEAPGHRSFSGRGVSPIRLDGRSPGEMKMAEWQKSDWRRKPRVQMPDWPDQEALAAAEAQL